MPTSQRQRARIASATAYVTSRFYPPLPAAYGELAVKAVDRVNRGDSTPLDVSKVNPIPRQAYVSGNGRFVVDPYELVCALRLQHLIDDTEED